MGTRVANKQDTRTALLNAGMEMMLEKGYTNTGVQEVLSSLGVPKGSFYHYFESKENFAVSIIRQFDAEYCAMLDVLLNDNKVTPLHRLKQYCEIELRKFQEKNCRKDCLIGHLGQEMADQSETLGTELSGVMAKWRSLFAKCIEDGQVKGEIRKDCQSDQLAEVFLSGWSGAVMKAKTVKNVEPMQFFIELMFGKFLSVQDC